VDPLSGEVPGRPIATTCRGFICCQPSGSGGGFHCPNHSALFLDGTWNTVNDNTNVWRIKSICADDGVTQLTYYDPGLGTAFGQKFTGGIWGLGINDNVIDAYKWLVEHYDEADEIFIFGFSRGAYTARSLSGLIGKCGLLKLGAPLSIRQLYDRYKRGAITTIRTLIEQRAGGRTDFCREEEWILQYSRDTEIKFVGVWDTVGSVGAAAEYLNTGVRRQNRFCFHALAIDENRADFAPTLWTKKVTKGSPEDPPPRSLSQVEQRWFVGAHGNIGGGCDNDLLVQLPFKWIMDKARLHGLAFRQEITIDGDPRAAPYSDSFRDFLHGVYPWISRRYYRPIGVDLEETDNEVVINETIDSSVFDRWRFDPQYRPHNLIEWAHRYDIDVGSIVGSIRADSRLTPLAD
jgi:hypothetical protein